VASVALGSSPNVDDAKIGHVVGSLDEVFGGRESGQGPESPAARLSAHGAAAITLRAIAVSTSAS
jgi:hypothetical protein